MRRGAVTTWLSERAGVQVLRDLLEAAGIDDLDPAEFRRYGSARRLYNFTIDNAGSY